MLAAGTRLGPYEILSSLGAGGMGEVYKARDARLDRTVAIKVLPEHLATSPDRKARFEREAKAISQLNHPHICTLHDVGAQDGLDFLIMEHLEGETLAERLKQGALTLDEALGYGIQIADGLDKAHRAGIVHRDLKPGNVMLTASGVKLLDFGLAKVIRDQLESEASDAPTKQRDLTKDQSIIGTIQYMAPEQLEGKSADARADVFAFGAVLYEMLTGRKAFEGESQASLISAIMSADPRPPSELAPIVPKSLDRLVHKCLAKAPDDRWQTVRDVTTELEWLQKSLTHEEVSQPASAAINRLSFGWLAAVLLLGGLLGFGLTRAARDVNAPYVTRMVIPLPEGQRLVERRTPPLALSPDGRRLVYAAETENGSQLYLRPLDAFDSTPIPGTEGGHSPFFSPDGEWVGFFTSTELKKVRLTGGGATTLAPAEPLSQGGSWGPDGTIVYAPSSGASAPLMKLPAAGGRPERITGRGMSAQPANPQVLSDGDTVLFTRIGVRDGTSLVSLSSSNASELELIGPTFALFMPTGHLLRTSSATTLEIVPFDPEERSVHGDPVPVLHDVVAGQGGSLTVAPYLTVAAAGNLAYVTGPPRDEFLVLVDRQGTPRRLTRGPVHAPRFSPDGRRIAYDADGSAYIYDIERDTTTRLSLAPNASAQVVWKPDGRLIVQGIREGGLYQKPADGSGESKRLLNRSLFAAPESWSRDGRYIAFTETHPETGSDIWVFPVDADREPVPFLVTPAAENAATFSPNGRYVAYQSDESGTREIYVRPFPEGGARWQISSNGGTAPVWSPDGDELYYRGGRPVMVVDVDTGDDFSAGRPRVLFDGELVVDNTGHPSYDIAPDGESFVMVQQVRDAPLTEIHVVLNWFDELTRLLPPDE